jgi:hypothetical protein
MRLRIESASGALVNDYRIRGKVGLVQVCALREASRCTWLGDAGHGRGAEIAHNRGLFLLEKSVFGWVLRIP